MGACWEGRSAEGRREAGEGRSDGGGVGVGGGAGEREAGEGRGSGARPAASARDHRDRHLT